MQALIVLDDDLAEMSAALQETVGVECGVEIEYPIDDVNETVHGKRPIHGFEVRPAVRLRDCHHCNTFVNSAPENGSVKDRHFVTALARGIQILRCFTHDNPELSSSDIVRLTGMPQPTVWRLCHTLQQAGLIVCSGHGRTMALGVPVLALGYAALVRQKLPQLALPYMKDLTERYRVGMSLAVRDGLEMTSREPFWTSSSAQSTRKASPRSRGFLGKMVPQPRPDQWRGR